MRLNSCSFCFHGNDVYFVDEIFPMLFRQRGVESVCEVVCELPESEPGYGAYIDIVSCGQYIVCIPCTSKYFAIYDLVNKKCKTIYILSILKEKNVNFTNENFLFNFAVTFDKRVIVFGAGVDCIVSLTPKNENVEIHTSLMSKLRAMAPIGTSFFRNDTEVVDGNIFLASSFDRKIIRLNLHNFSYEIYEYSDDCVGHIGLAIYKESLWAMRKNGVLDRYEMEGLNIVGCRECVRIVPDDDLRTGRFFSFSDSLIYLNEKNRKAYILRKDNTIIEKALPPSDAPLPGIALWPKVVCRDGLCFMIDSQKRSFLTFHNDFKIHCDQTICCYNIPYKFVWNNIRYEDPLGVTLPDLLAANKEDENKCQSVQETCGYKIWRATIG